LVPKRDDQQNKPVVHQPGKVLRLAMMVRQLLDEVRDASLDEASRHRLREIYDQTRLELAHTLGPDLAEELERVALPLDSLTPSKSELRLAQAQLIGWLEGLFQGIQATVFAQEMAAQAQLQQMQRRSAPVPGQGPQAAEEFPGNYF
jgi:Protein of unknown function (DUF2587)